VPTWVAGLLPSRRWFTLIAIGAAALVASGCVGESSRSGGPLVGPSVPSGVDGGYDISWVQCGGQFPKNAVFGIVGVSQGLPFHDNPCVVAEYRWAAAASIDLGWAAAGSYDVGFYVNAANPGAQSVHWTAPGPRACSGASGDRGCAYNYGYNAARHAFEYTAAKTEAAAGKAWWLDIETANSWSADVSSNRADIQGMLDYLNSQPGVTPGIYSTGAQWTQITGGAGLASTPVWRPATQNHAPPPTFCTSAHSFTGESVTMVQYPAGSFDGDYAC
jgi:hypothetical protein